MLYIILLFFSCSIRASNADSMMTKWKDSIIVIAVEFAVLEEKKIFSIVIYAICALT